MENQIFDAYKSYTELAEKRVLAEASDDSQSKGNLILIKNKFHWIRNIVDELEKSNEFNNLSLLVGEEFGLKGKANISSSIPNYCIQNYFKRSGFYTNLFKEKEDIKAPVFSEFISQFKKRKVTHTSLRLINSIQFDEENIEFDEFSIKRFSNSQLDQLVENDICTLFYPEYYVDTNNLHQYWYFVEHQVIDEDEKDFSKIKLNFDIDDIDKIRPQFPDKLCQILALFDWENVACDEYFYQSFSYSNPISLTANDDYLSRPPLKTIDYIPTKPVFTPDGEEYEEPEYYIDLSNQDLKRFKESIIKNTDKITRLSNSKKWSFINNAVAFLAKAQFSTGIEQLLWNITAIESALGEKNQIVDSISRRLGILFGDSDLETINTLTKKFRGIYDLRSDYLHGSVEKTIESKDVLKARNLARMTVQKMIDLLASLDKSLNENDIPANNCPNRKTILKAIDFQLSIIKINNKDIPFG
jgi:hypothetical protein